MPVSEFPFEFFRVPTEQALPEILRLRQCGKVAVIVGDPDDFTSLQDELAHYGQVDIDELLEEVDDIDLADHLENDMDERPRAYRVNEQIWPNDVPSVTLLWGATDQAASERVLTVLPTEHAWMTPWFLKRDCNNGPTIEAHVAWAKYWQERYGAELTVTTHSTVEFTVSNPPRTKADALELARQHFMYCEDVVEQNYGTVHALAASLLNATVWSFWRD